MSKNEASVLVEPKDAANAEIQVSLLVPGQRPPVKDRAGHAVVADHLQTRKSLETRAGKGLSLTCMDLGWADLSRVDLPGADLSHCSLFQANFTDADLLEADLSGTDLRGAILRRVNLTGALLVGADLTGADLTGANLAAITYDSSTRWPDGFVPPESLPFIAIGDDSEG